MRVSSAETGAQAFPQNRVDGDESGEGGPVAVATYDPYVLRFIQP